MLFTSTGGGGAGGGGAGAGGPYYEALQGCELKPSSQPYNAS